MTNLPDTVKAIQRHCGAEPDGVFGPATAAKVLAELQRAAGIDPTEGGMEGASCDGHRPPLQAPMDARTLATIGTLDPKARDRFTRFALLAKATAATMGCDYVAISGHRTWEEQDALYAKRPRVTKAAGGYSWHNFGIACDFAVFFGRVYADEALSALAERVHLACAAHAAACGLEWGGSWKTFPDIPHYQIPAGLTLAAARLVYKKGGSVL